MVIVSANLANNSLVLANTQTTSQIAVNDPIILQNFVYSIGNLVNGQEFTILNAGTTDFTQFGASSNAVGTTFTANSTGIVSSANLVNNLQYTILVAGNTNWTLVGANSNTVGTTFTANSTYAGTGTAVQGNGTVSSLSIGGIEANVIYYVNSIVNASSFTVSDSINGTPITVTNDANANVTLTSQVGAVALSSQTGNMVMNIGSPLSPGQIDGQLFNFYGTANAVISNVSGNIGNLLSRNINLTNDSTLVISNASGGLNYLYAGFEFDVTSNIANTGIVVGTYTIADMGYVEITDITTANVTDNSFACSDTTLLYLGMPIQFTGIPAGNVNLGQEYFIANIVANTSFKISQIQFGNVLELGATTFALTLLGEPYITVSTAISGRSEEQYTIVQSTAAMTPTPMFDVGYVMGGYTAAIVEPSKNFVENNTIEIDGSVLGGNSGTNNLTITVNSVGSIGDITNVSKIGTPPSTSGQYYLKPISDNQCEVYSDALMTLPVSGLELANAFPGIVSTTALATQTTGNIIVGNATNFIPGDAVVFTGYFGNAFGGIEVGKPYYILTSNAITQEVTLASSLANSTPITITSNATGNYTMTKSGSFAFLPEPFYFDQSLVIYNNRVYRCVISNNDEEFVLGKWELVQSDTRSLNALDRVQGYYQPTINMPGKDLSQLVMDITYPNSQYLDNPFAPEDQFAYDTFLTDLSANSTYDVQGDAFLSGYGPEELVPGIVSDNLTLLVTTRPGTTWPAEEYGHVGYNVVSISLSPTIANQTEYSFAGVVENPAEIAVSLVDSSTGLAIKLNENTDTTYDYSIDWVNKKVILNTPITTSQSLQIDVYEVGNGDQLVKSNTDNQPAIINDNTGFSEILLNCNYSAGRSVGSGLIIPNTQPTQVEATETDSLNNSIRCESVEEFVLNAPITFQGDVFGNIVLGATYYVKTINLVTNRITISDTITAGTAGPTFLLDDAEGSMEVIILTGNGLTWTDPIILHNGRKLTLGEQSVISQTKADGTIVCNSTSLFAVNEPIVFSKDIDSFGTPIVSNQTYYIANIIDNYQFTISDTVGGSVLSLIDAVGTAICITSDYAIAMQDIGIQAKLVFSNNIFSTLTNGVLAYDSATDFISFSVFGETAPIQYGYTLPQAQVFTGNSDATYSLVNFVGGVNPTNAIVEVNGVRLSSGYTIDPNTDTITFTSNVSGNVISVTTFNDTNRQYLNTQYEITGKQVNQIINVDNDISGALAVTQVTATSSVGNVITCASTSGFVAGQTVTFKGTGFGNIQTDGTVYFVKSFGPTSFVIEDDTNTEIALTNGLGSMTAFVGAKPAVRITTAAPHNFVTNDIVRIDGVLGSIQLNNNTYYVHYIDSTRFDLYNGLYSVNDPVTVASTYISGGYVWLNDEFLLATTTASATTTSTNHITVASTSSLVVGTPVYFSGNVFGGVISGSTYYVKEIVGPTEFTISAERNGEEVSLTTDTGTMNVTQWEQENVDRLYVTVNGYRVPSTALRINPNNNLSILTPVQPADLVTITNMIPSATPNQLVYIQNVNKSNEASVFRANHLTETWLTQSLYATDESILVKDASRLITNVVQNVVTPAQVGGVYTIGLDADKNSIVQILVYNNSTGFAVSSDYYTLKIVNGAPNVEITNGVTTGDSLTITTMVGNLIYINGEQIKFSQVDLTTNTLSGLSRGVNGTGAQDYVPPYVNVYGLLPTNKLPETEYNQIWNSYTYNQVLGDPLQISTTESARFLNNDVS